MSTPTTTRPRTMGQIEKTGHNSRGMRTSSPQGSCTSHRQESVMIAPEAICFRRWSLSTTRPPTKPREESELAGPASDVLSAGFPHHWNRLRLHAKEKDPADDC